MSSPKKSLVIAPHADDETLGMGGTIAKKMNQGEDVVIAVMTGHGEEPHPLWKRELWDEIRSETREAIKSLGNPRVEFFELPGLCLPEYPTYETNRVIAEIVNREAPTELFLPYYHDLHHDHQIVCHAGLVASRGYLANASKIELVAMYETPTETHLMPAAIQSAFSPNYFVDISDHIDDKLAAWSSYASQQQTGFTPRSPAALSALATLRGSEIGVAAAEGFVLVRGKAG